MTSPRALSKTMHKGLSLANQRSGLTMHEHKCGGAYSNTTKNSNIDLYLNQNITKFRKYVFCLPCMVWDHNAWPVIVRGSQSLTRHCELRQCMANLIGLRPQWMHWRVRIVCISYWMQTTKRKVQSSLHLVNVSIFWLTSIFVICKGSRVNSSRKYCKLWTVELFGNFDCLQN